MEFKEKKEATLIDVKKFEDKFKANIPQTYRNFLIKQNGGYLKDDSYMFLDYTINGFLGINNGVKYFDLMEEYEYLVQILPKDYFPIASDFGGNYYIGKINTKKLPIYFWDHNLQTEGTKAVGLKRIANSFSDFISNIKIVSNDIDVKVTVSNGKIILE